MFSYTLRLRQAVRTILPLFLKFALILFQFDQSDQEMFGQQSIETSGCQLLTSVGWFMFFSGIASLKLWNKNQQVFSRPDALAGSITARWDEKLVWFARMLKHLSRSF